MPKRIQLKRSKGWRMPANTVKVDRTTKFGNPFKVGEGRTVEEAVAAFRFSPKLQRLARKAGGR